MDLDGGFPIPAEAGVGGEIAFEHRAGIDVVTLGAADFLELCVELGKAFLDEVVVVVVPGVAGDSVVGGMGFWEWGTASVVVDGEGDDGSAAGKDFARVGTAGGVAL